MSNRTEFAELFFSKTKDFLDVFLPRQENRSPETVKAYKLSLTCFYNYVTTECKRSAIAFCFSDCTYDFVLKYLQYMQEKKKLANSTVNQRLAALKSYLRYVSDGNIALMQIYLGVQKVPLLKLYKLQRPIIEKNGLAMMLNKPLNTKIGNRDRMILIILFDTAIRISELLDITLGDISIEISAPSILIHGKGKKQRVISLNDKTTGHLQEYIRVYHEINSPADTHLFYTIIHGKMNRMSERNVERIVKKNADLVRKESPGFPDSCYPHMLRRTRATGLYRDGVPLEMISAILGHSSSETTKTYAIPSVEQMREALKKGQEENQITEKLWEGKDDEIRRMFGLS
ncbi:MAG: tyrosine-type recombinase/integrase [Clostridiales bacterium]|nr:tyrosine-type recombinase/integrase [Clostridiales bacterium]